MSAPSLTAEQKAFQEKRVKVLCHSCGWTGKRMRKNAWGNCPQCFGSRVTEMRRNAPPRADERSTS